VKNYVGCMTPDCEHGKRIGRRTRGLCDRCYSRIRKMVADKQTTWAALEEQGLTKKIDPQSARKWSTGHA
jgi:hypothetical protein